MIVEDARIVITDLANRLSALGYEVVGTATSGEAAVTVAEHARPDLVLMGLHLPGAMDRITAAHELRTRLQLPVVLLAAAGEDVTLQHPREAGTFASILKPDEDRELQLVIEMALYKHQTERKIHNLKAELEQQVAERSAQTELSNNEIGDFAFVVSHDLRAPLRAIDGYTGILVEDHASSLNEEGKRICAIISQSARDMRKLIDDLLAFSSIGRSVMEYSSVDMATLAHSIFFEETNPQGRERIDFHVGPLPCVVADPNLMRQVWMNLLSNAVKFSSKKQRAAIDVTATARDDEMVFSVRDNGVGFDMRHVDKLFGVFQRLHSVQQFEGTGMGLAIVRRIVERHGGRTWAEGKIGKGATIHFALHNV